MQPPPVYWYLSSLQEEAAGEEEESCGCNHNCISCNVAWNKCTYKHHISICCDERGVEDQPEVEEIAFEFKDEFGDGCKCETLDGKEWEVDNKRGNDVRRSAICIVGCLSDEDEPFLDKCRDSVVGGEENKADCEDVEVEKAVDVFEGWMAEVSEKGR